ncbi:MAG TPA: MAPEG family protein [Kofleriaceae bacterium]|jgi:uncharacterized MAPEG superfamily protein
MLLYVPYVCLLVAVVLIYLPRSVVSAEMAKLSGGYDNNDPRGQQAQLAGRGKRALGAHNNGFETFPAFAVGVLMAMQIGVSLELVSACCIGFVVARVAYIVAYLGDNSKLRSPLWGLQMLASAVMMIAAVVDVSKHVP